MVPKKYRLLTRSDFDGLASAVLLKSLDVINEIKFVHPKDMQDGKIEVTGNDITTNLPYIPGTYLSFEHHTETIRSKENNEHHITYIPTPSTTRLVYYYFGGEQKFGNKYEQMIAAVDKSSSGTFTIDDVLNPQKWTLLNFVMDPRTGLGRFKDFRISNYQLMLALIDYCKNYTVDEILNLHDVKERVDLYYEQQDKFKDQIERCAKFYQNVSVIDLRLEETIYAGNRFMVYALFNTLFPENNVSIHIFWGLRKQNTVFSVGKSIFNRSLKANLGELMLKYGGGGHGNAGACQVENDQADIVLHRVISQLNQDV